MYRIIEEEVGSELYGAVNILQFCFSFFFFFFDFRKFHGMLMCRLKANVNFMSSDYPHKLECVQP